LGGADVVVEAAGDVQDFVGLQSEMLQGCLEVRGRGLVGAHALGADQVFELDAKGRDALPEGCRLDVGEQG